MILFSAEPSCTIDSWCASFIVASLTDSKVSLFFVFSLNDKSRIPLNFLLLCGIIASGDILSFVGILFLISFHLIIFAKPLATFVCASAMKHLRASGTLADG